jgi:hypothetical protein
MTRNEILEIQAASNLEYFTEKYLGTKLPENLFKETHIPNISEDTMLKYVLWDAMFRFDRTSIIIYPNAAWARDGCQKLSEMCFDRLPDWLRSGTKKITRDEIKFDTGSRIWFRGFNAYAVKGLKLNTLALSTRLHEDEYSSMSIEGPTRLIPGKKSKLISFI